MRYDKVGDILILLLYHRLDTIVSNICYNSRIGLKIDYNFILFDILTIKYTISIEKIVQYVFYIIA